MTLRFAVGIVAVIVVAQPKPVYLERGLFHPILSLKSKRSRLVDGYRLVISNSQVEFYSHQYA
jgi:hypothetical protein